MRTPAILKKLGTDLYVRDICGLIFLTPHRDRATVYAYVRDAKTRRDELPFPTLVVTLSLPSIPEIVEFGDPIV